MRKFIKWIINIILIGVLIYSGYNIYIKLKEYKQADVTYSKIREIKNSGKEDLSILNKDFRFWIMVDGTNIDYPVVQSKDNYFYLYKDFYGNKLGSGTIFMDYRNDYKNDKNTILYGHNMQNNTMFSQLESFKDPEFWNKNNKIRIMDKDKEYVYEVFSAYVIDPGYDYLTTDFNSDEEFMKYLDDVKAKSLNKSDVVLSPDDKVITLSTCSYEFKNARTVVHGRLIEEK